MAKQVLTDCRLFVAGADISGNTNTVELSAEFADQDVTNYRSGGWKEAIAGLGSSSVKAGGQWEALDTSMVDDALWALSGSTQAPWTICPSDSTVGTLAWLVNGQETTYAPAGGSVGDVASWQANASSSWPLSRGKILHPTGTVRTTTGVGTSVQLAAVPAGARLYASLHLLSITGGGSIVVRIESDNATGFPSPATVNTFASLAARGSEIQRSNGTAITDDWFRAAWTVTGTVSALFVVAVGID